MNTTTSLIDSTESNLSAEEKEQIERENKFSAIINNMFETYHKKNLDYGNSFGKSVEEFGFVAAIIRMNDKMNRLKSLVKNQEVHVTDESIKDTLLDLANYAVMTLIEL